jgi:hypothetical protein
MLLRSGRRVATGEEAARAAVSRRRTRRTRPDDQLAVFPEEILQEILARLPAKSVLRCRAVCRSWRSLASEPAFLLDHHRHQPELHLISSYRTVEGVDDFYPAPDAVHLRGAELRPVFGFPELFHYPLTVDASCDGLFIAGNYICNPATRQWAPLSSNPKRPVLNPVGLYRHQPSGEYRVLYWTHSNVPVPMPLVLPVVLCPNEYRVLTVGTNESRSVDCPLTKMIGARGPTICGARRCFSTAACTCTGRRGRASATTRYWCLTRWRRRSGTWSRRP